MSPSAFPIHQALAARHGDAEVRWLGQSADFDERLKPLLEALAVGFGPRPEGVGCPEAWIVLPRRGPLPILARVADLGEAGCPPAALGFQFLTLTLADFGSAGGDAFRLIQAAPPIWHLRGALPTLTGARLLELKPLAEVVRILKSEDSPLLLGSVQALLDGSRLAFRRREPANNLVAGLWSLLPFRNRLEFSAATFAFGNALKWNVLAIPEPRPEEFDHRWLSEEQAGNYPEGRYELGLQLAAEADDEPALVKLLMRRTRADTLRMGLWMLGGMVAATAAFGALRMLRP